MTIKQTVESSLKSKISRRDLLVLSGVGGTAIAIGSQLLITNKSSNKFARLKEAGVKVKATNYTSVTHEFLEMGAVNKGKQAVSEAAVGLRTGSGR